MVGYTSARTPGSSSIVIEKNYLKVFLIIIIIPLTLVGYEITKANSRDVPHWLSTTSYPMCNYGIIATYHMQYIHFLFRIIFLLIMRTKRN